VVALVVLMEQGVSYEEVLERAKNDNQLEQELIWLNLKGLEPKHDGLPRLDLWPGHAEYRGQRRKSYHHGPGRTTTVRENYGAFNKKTFHPWRDLAQCWPEHRKIVEIQIRGSNSATGTARIPKAYHVNKVWFDAETDKPIRSIVERWRMVRASMA
jgi:hypothetical protein